MAKKKHYHMGDTAQSEEQKKDMGTALDSGMYEFKNQLEKQEANAKAEELDVNKLIAEFPYRPNGDRAIILAHSNERKLSSGIIIPDTVTEKPQIGTIIAIGEESSLQHKILEHLEVIRSIVDPTFDDELEPAFNTHKTGDVVVFGKMAGAEIEVEGIKYLALRISDLWATVK